MHVRSTPTIRTLQAFICSLPLLPSCKCQLRPDQNFSCIIPAFPHILLLPSHDKLEVVDSKSLAFLPASLTLLLSTPPYRQGRQVRGIPFPSDHAQHRSFKHNLQYCIPRSMLRAFYKPLPSIHHQLHLRLCHIQQDLFQDRHLLIHGKLEAEDNIAPQPFPS